MVVATIKYASLFPPRNVPVLVAQKFWTLVGRWDRGAVEDYMTMDMEQGTALKSDITDNLLPDAW